MVKQTLILGGSRTGILNRSNHLRRRNRRSFLGLHCLFRTGKAKDENTNEPTENGSGSLRLHRIALSYWLESVLLACDLNTMGASSITKCLIVNVTTESGP
ncbi:hypothetical protein Sinac_4233 [Singulisphaera acidiphila DSM 18658]|uniref:Uncharacterized protein n=1 Tax=Singulisphaera acidiphila (strain ATCC BAA-1392 / DSM 18658 / VKM B-2454 / MOB10) TaxID=886293 RepID=L0DIH2_SINAD|nr:hypothetical protein Sinac_4233 [Singulisphaera acidiphila DSM 18658]